VHPEYDRGLWEQKGCGKKDKATTTMMVKLNQEPPAAAHHHHPLEAFFMTYLRMTPTI
jgi:hypothetical protein